MTTDEYIQLRKQYMEIENAMRQQQEQLRQIRKSQSWWLDFSSNIAGNAVWDGLLWIGSRLIKKL